MFIFILCIPSRMQKHCLSQSWESLYQAVVGLTWMKGLHFLEVLAASEGTGAAHNNVHLGQKACYLLRAFGGRRHCVQLEKSEELFLSSTPLKFLWGEYRKFLSNKYILKKSQKGIRTLISKMNLLKMPLWFWTWVQILNTVCHRASYKGMHLLLLKLFCALH